jgi:hypothetical protein
MLTFAILGPAIAAISGTQFAAASLAVAFSVLREPGGVGAVRQTPSVVWPVGGSQDVVPMKPPRDPNLAVREEYEIAIAKNTSAALSLFILRHPESPLAEQARARLKSIKR